ncbi:MAG: HAD family hydrolase [Anaerolineales bacterium]
MKPFDAIFFDLGNTLIYFNGDWQQVFSQSKLELRKQLKKEGVDIDEAEFLEQFSQRIYQYHNERETDYIEQTTAVVLKKLLVEYGYPNFPDVAIQRALKAMYAVSQDRWHPDPDAVPILKSLQEKGYRLGLISNAADDQDVQDLVDKANIRHYFEQVYSSASAGIRKPHPRIFNIVLDEMEIDPSRAAMVGDSLSADIQGANNAGLFSIWVTKYADKLDNQTQPGSIKPNATIQTLRDLLKLLDSLSERGNIDE